MLQGGWDRQQRVRALISFRDAASWRPGPLTAELQALVVATAALVTVLAGGASAAEAPAEQPTEMTSVEVRVPGLPPLRLFTDPNDTTIRPVLEELQIWEDLETKWVLNTIRPGDVFIDVGANIGYYTVVASKVVGPTGHVFAFEPDPASFAILERNVRENGLTNVTLEQKALSNEPGLLRLYIAGENKGDHRLFDQADAPREFVDVEALRLDDYLEEHDTTVDFIKVDTQGAEGIILEGMLGTIRANPGIAMVMEYMPVSLRSVGTDPEEMIARLEELGFRMFSLGVGFRADLQPKPVRSEDVFTGTSVLFSNLLLFPGLERLKELDQAVREAEAALQAAAQAQPRARGAWERQRVAALEAHPWTAPSSVETYGARGVSVEETEKGCVEIERSSSEPGKWSARLALASARALRIRVRNLDSDGARAFQVIDAARTLDDGSTLSFSSPRWPDELVPPGPKALLRSERNIAGVLQTQPLAAAASAAELEFTFHGGTPVEMCFLETAAAAPMDSDLEMGLGTSESARNQYLNERILSAFAAEDARFEAERATLERARAERLDYQTLDADKIQKWIRSAR